jgi:hypothetical protein
MIRGGWAYVFGATANVSVGGPVLGVGANVDLTNTLGVDTSTDAFRFDGLYRFNDRHIRVEFKLHSVLRLSGISVTNFVGG